MSRDHKETWECPFCGNVNEDTRYAATSSGFYKAGQWYPDEMAAVRCKRCEFSGDWQAIDSGFAFEKMLQKDPDAHPFGTPMGGN